MTTTSAPATEAPPFTHRLFALLRMLARGRGSLMLEARSLHGFGHERPRIQANPEDIPVTLLKSISEGMELGSQIIATRTDGAPTDLTALAVLWRPATQFNATTGWRHVVDLAAAKKIRETLAAFALAPAFLVDAGPQAAAFWPLTDPLPVDREQGPALALLEGLARRLGADLNAARSLATTYPLAGVIRNWNVGPPERMEIIELAPEQAYSLEQLQEALAEDGAVPAGRKERS